MRRRASTARLKRGPVGQVFGSSPPIDERGYTRAMRHLAAVVTFAFAVMAAQLLSARTQERMKPTAPGTPGDPTWQGVVRLTDGRTFVTDGGLAIDAAIAKPAKLPARALAPRALEGFLNAAHKEECSFSDLRAGATGANLCHSQPGCAERHVHQLPPTHVADPVSAISDDRTNSTRGGCRERQRRRRADAREAVTKA